MSSPPEDLSVKSAEVLAQDNAADSDSPDDTRSCTPPVTNPSDAVDPEKGPSLAQPDPPFSVFSQAQKIFIVFIAALTILIPPLTASIYYPVITQLAGELHVSITDINLTITTYLVHTPSLLERLEHFLTDCGNPTPKDNPRHCSFVRGQFFR